MRVGSWYPRKARRCCASSAEVAKHKNSRTGSPSDYWVFYVSSVVSVRAVFQHAIFVGDDDFNAAVLAASGGRGVIANRVIDPKSYSADAARIDTSVLQPLFHGGGALGR